MSSHFLALKFEEHCLTQSGQTVAQRVPVVGRFSPVPLLRSLRRSSVFAFPRSQIRRALLDPKRSNSGTKTQRLIPSVVGRFFRVPLLRSLRRSSVFAFPRPQIRRALLDPGRSNSGTRRWYKTLPIARCFPAKFHHGVAFKDLGS